MRTISFKNFRRFKNFPEINLGDITLLVGANNSGKSTLIQAILLCENNLRQNISFNLKSQESDYSHLNCPTFKFDGTNWNDVRIKTFQRAVNKEQYQEYILNGNSKVSENNLITFCFAIGYFKFEITIQGNRQYNNEIECEILFLSVEDFLSNYRLEEYYPSHERRFILLKEDINEVDDNRTKFWKSEFSHLVGDVQIAKQLRNGFYNNTIKQIYNLNYEEYYSGEYNLLVYMFDNLLQFAKNTNIKYIRGKYEYSDVDNNGYCYNKAANFISSEENEKSRAFLSTQIEKIYSTKERLKTLTSNNFVEYFKIHFIEQHYFLDATNGNDYVAKTINDYYKAKIKHTDIECKFVKRWLKKLDIGDSFKIKCLGGESFFVELRRNKAHSINLADMGIGSIQIFTLLIRIAYIMRKYKLSIRNNIKCYDDNGKIINLLKGSWIEDFTPMIIVEEPEQNLHPKIQSLLADLFFELSQKYGIKFIVETHSEYLIRKSQAIVKDFAKKNKIKTKEKLDEMNPFKVYYFDSQNEIEPYYKMKYRTDGNFSNEFGPGFYDESTKLLLDIL